MHRAGRREADTRRTLKLSPIGVAGLLLAYLASACLPTALGDGSSLPGENRELLDALRGLHFDRYLEGPPLEAERSLVGGWDVLRYQQDDLRCVEGGSTASRRGQARGPTARSCGSMEAARVGLEGTTAIRTRGSTGGSRRAAWPRQMKTTPSGPGISSTSPTATEVSIWAMRRPTTTATVLSTTGTGGCEPRPLRRG